MDCDRCMSDALLENEPPPGEPARSAGRGAVRRHLLGRGDDRRSRRGHGRRAGDPGAGTRPEHRAVAGAAGPHPVGDRPRPRPASRRRVRRTPALTTSARSRWSSRRRAAGRRPGTRREQALSDAVDALTPGERKVLTAALEKVLARITTNRAMPTRSAACATSPLCPEPGLPRRTGRPRPGTTGFRPRRRGSNPAMTSRLDIQPYHRQGPAAGLPVAHAFGAAAVTGVALLLLVVTRFRSQPVPVPVLIAVGRSLALAAGLAADLTARPPRVVLGGDRLTCPGLADGSGWTPGGWLSGVQPPGRRQRHAPRPGRQPGRSRCPCPGAEAADLAADLPRGQPRPPSRFAVPA